MIRLFVAYDIPDDVRMLICGMGATIPGARAVPADQLHLTLKFIGDVEESVLVDIREALAEISLPPLTICLQGVGHFPPRGTPKVLWCGVSPAMETIQLRNAIEKALAAVGIERERRKFSPHVTLARLRNSPLKRVTQFLAGNSMFETPPFRVDTFRLYSSVLSAKGAVHTVEAEFSLTATGSGTSERI